MIVTPGARGLRALRHEAGAATAASTCVRVVEPEAAADEVAGVLESRILEVHGRLGVAHDFEALDLRLHIVRAAFDVDLHHVFEAGTTAAFHSDTHECIRTA